ncbi:unnamed protein product [Adineta ricciae]|uniref:Uncharacterized protein n=1 Tax=Adineta ricciae TaxID=249248 RepID=A0A814G3C8_ADIRI|nr:unnamed protein product [Adineta ricciae]CAF1003829.1 unnamed protein product [Adineta ricciae]
MSFFGKKDKRTPYEIAREQSRAISTQIRQEKRQLDRQINQSDREILRLSNDIRKHAMTNNKDALRTLAKAVVKIKRDKSNLYAAKANLDTIDGAVKSQLTNVRITGVMQTSSQIAHSLAELMKVEQFQSISEQFSKELIKMGIMSEMMNEAVDAATDNNDLEEETDEEVDKILNEILAGKVSQLPPVIDNQPLKLPTVDVDSEEDEMQKRLEALRS